MSERTAAVTHPDQLPERQRLVLELLAEGKTDREIAGALGLAVQTVKNHCTALYRRLPIGRAGSPRTAAVAWYLRLVPPEPAPPPGRSTHDKQH